MIEITPWITYQLAADAADVQAGRAGVQGVPGRQTGASLDVGEHRGTQPFGQRNALPERADAVGYAADQGQRALRTGGVHRSRRRHGRRGSAEPVERRHPGRGLH
jgi:hypothetical protein